VDPHIAGLVGSSPHPRGAPAGPGRAPGFDRLIPASAGSTARPPGPPPSGRAHPRIRGEHGAGGGGGSYTSGSSPHPRGALAAGRRRYLRPRLIPASAGSTRDRARQCPPVQAHPRIRGEHQCSPPGAPRSSGLIPASAGSTHATWTGSWTRSAHPRIRGEHSQQATRRITTGGSSPHPRGAHREGDDVDAVLGLIPASAGSTC